MAGPEWIVKLVPIGNPESKLFVIETVGGSPGTDDFVGWHLDQFTFTSHITTGQVTVLLANVPSSIASCYCLVAESQRIITPVSLVSSSLTVTKYKLLYDKPATPTGLVSDAPSGVSVASSSGAITGDTAPGASASTSTTPATDGSGAGPDNAISDASVSVTVSAHHHTIDSLYDHKHPLSFSQIALPLALNESTRMVVLYK